eukprot:COSAG01_NODE_25477_length_743_cov_6.649068_1_plen_66_part_01
MAEPEPECAGATPEDVPSRVRVTVHSGLELPSKDWDTGASDPYVEIRVVSEGASGDLHIKSEKHVT